MDSLGRLYQHRRNTPKALCLSRLPFSSAYIEPSLWYSVFPQSMVRMMGLEPIRPIEHQHLKLACLPIPAHSHMERMTRLELAPSAWKADMLATRHHIRIFGSLKVYQPTTHGLYQPSYFPSRKIKRFLPIHRYIVFASSQLCISVAFLKIMFSMLLPPFHFCLIVWRERCDSNTRRTVVNSHPL